MKKTLVLMRHGKALPLAEGQEDIDRPLSEAGRRSLAAMLPNMLKPLGCVKGPVCVWTSPARRASESAELMYNELKASKLQVAGPVEEHESLWTQDATAFLEELRTSEHETVIAAGHNPFVESLAETLCGATLPCATGALVCIRVNFLEDGSCSSASDKRGNRLLWFSQGPVSQRWKTLVELEGTLASWADTVAERKQRFLDFPEDIETLHKFRVSIRTLRSLVAFIKPWQDPSQNAQIQTLLKEAVACTSKQRELDVFARQAEKSPDCSPELVEFCLHEADEEREVVLKTISSKPYTKKLDKALALAKDIAWRPKRNRIGLAANDVRAHFDSMIGALEAEMDCLDLSDAELTHDVRKRAKRARYAAENFQDIVGADAVDIAKNMTAHQDDLGALCDARVNINMINGFLDRDLPETVAWDLTLLRAQNETFLITALKNCRKDAATTVPDEASAEAPAMDEAQMDEAQLANVDDDGELIPEAVDEQHPEDGGVRILPIL